MPLTLRVEQVIAADGKPWVQLSIFGPTGKSVFFFDTPSAVALGRTLVGSGPQLAVVEAGS